MLASAGYGSRREIEALMAAGRVMVNDKPAVLGMKVGPADHVTIDGKPCNAPPSRLVQSRVIGIHKPAAAKRWVMVGRLDLTTSGLVLFTDDGELAHRLTHPSYEIARRYAVRVLGTPTEEDVAAMLAGVEVEGEVLKFDRVAEVGGDNAEAERKAFTLGDHRLSSAYGFDFLYAPALTPAFAAEVLAGWQFDNQDDVWPSWAFENHDAPRAVSRWCPPPDRERFARVKAALLAALRGNIIVYQGEELGLLQDDIPFEQLRDPEAIANWPLTLSRDGARTPMPWTGDAGGGFTTATPWLPLSAQNLARNAAAQEADPGSLLHFTRHMLALRRITPALRHGSFKLLLADELRLAFVRTSGASSVYCLFNLAGADAAWPVEVPLTGRLVLTVGGAAPGLLPGYSALMIEV